MNQQKSNQLIQFGKKKNVQKKTNSIHPETPKRGLPRKICKTMAPT